MNVVRTLAALSVLALAACGGTQQPPAPGAPTLTISSPANNANITGTAANPDVPVAFAVTNFTLKAPGTCAGASACGHLHLFVDDTACNDVANHAPYNGSGFASPINAGLDYCPTIAGAHTIRLELHNDDHSAVKDSAGATVQSSVKITAS